MIATPDPFTRLRTAVACLLLVGTLAGCGGGAKPAAKDAPRQTVSVDQVALRNIGGGTAAAGRLVALEEVAVATDVSGYRVARVLVEEGARVPAGAPLAILDDSLLRSQIAQLEAQLVQQQVAAEQAAEQARRVDGLDSSGVLSSEAIAQRRFAARSTAASVNSTRAQLNDALVRRSHLVIRAPYAGTVIERTVRPGETASAGTAMFRMARDRLVEAYAEVPEAMAARLAVGDPASVKLASGRLLDGRVRLIGQRVDQTTGVVIARVALPIDPELRVGGFADVIFGGARTAPAVPDKAVRYDADGAFLMLVDARHRVHRVAVETGDRAGGYVELRKGPPVGSTVAVKGAAFTLDGDQVAIAQRSR
ncbi:efflux RND transporter periplasmic adaptor subunit [Novosphingobium flavum]|uniref:Efflux RND transporter periplasmic adaptor subunit n=1 Tax=Novosphingobium aerophilum TaxID=2839843 RepID=A0A7X1F5R8_9SPHN|nr:efflux RND transporter periplasmic adaptor subunit [Novosphingobium aerophilum]MBC2650907.1 efflux RND transporter periplasmic adaptor subunit [Novosphingobium aerophilum]MBC2663543.1 efflux RND transporter periplasmic adaptor subunit [Novosphingobium aerophilum]